MLNLNLVLFEGTHFNIDLLPVRLMFDPLYLYLFDLFDITLYLFDIILYLFDIILI